MTRWPLIGLVALAALAGCGDGDGGGGGESPRDQARAERLERFFRGSGQAEGWSLKAVKVDGGEVTFETGLEPTIANEDGFVLPCSTLVGIYAWVESIKVEGSDGKAHLSWDKQASGCDAEGLRE